MAELCGNTLFRDRPNFLPSADTDGDARRSQKTQDALYGEGASTHSWTPEIPHIPFQTDEFAMCGNFDPPPPPSDETGIPHVGGTALFLQRELSFDVLHELHNQCDDPKRIPHPPLPQHK